MEGLAYGQDQGLLRRVAQTCALFMTVSGVGVAKLVVLLNQLGIRVLEKEHTDSFSLLLFLKTLVVSRELDTVAGFSANKNVVARFSLSSDRENLNGANIEPGSGRQDIAH